MSRFGWFQARGSFETVVFGPIWGRPGRVQIVILETVWVTLWEVFLKWTFGRSVQAKGVRMVFGAVTLCASGRSVLWTYMESIDQVFAGKLWGCSDTGCVCVRAHTYLNDQSVRAGVSISLNNHDSVIGNHGLGSLKSNLCACW